jgi:hypothetical protein
MIERFGSEKQYNAEVVESFGREDGVELLIVVDTYFPLPRIGGLSDARLSYTVARRCSYAHPNTPS